MPEVTSLSFAFFFGLVLACVLLTRTSKRWIPLLAASVLFAACGSLASVALLSAFAAWGFAFARAIDAARRPRVRTALLAGAVGGGVAALWAFGPASAFGTGGAAAWPLGAGVGAAVPLGLSYYSLKVLAYLFEVHARRMPSERHFGRFFLYLAIFVELPAGPIDRPQALLGQLADVHDAGPDELRDGLRLIAWGLVKKIVVADRLGVFVGQAFLHPGEQPWPSLLLAALLFGVQLYCDFSAYSDLAVGLGRLLGLRLRRNFNAPYAARSVSEFWGRWHVSLSSWLRDYVFLPVAYRAGRALDALGVPARAADLAAFSASALVTMLLAGLWHGRRTTFLAWGAVLALFMIASVATRRARRSLVRRSGLGRVPRLLGAIRTAMTVAATGIAWVFFRASSLGEALAILRRIAVGLAGVARLAPGAAREAACPALAVARFGPGQATCLVLFALIAAAEARGREGEPAFDRLDRMPAWVRWPCYAAAVLAVLFLGVQGGAGFIYAGF